MTLTPTNSPLPPWRRGQRDHFPGVPAWGLATRRAAPEPFEISRLESVDKEWAYGGADGTGVRVCVLDTGVQADHPHVGGLEASYQVVADGNGKMSVAECEPHDPAGHGTACASVIRQVAPGASISSLRVLTDGKNGSGDALLTGLRWAIEAGFDVINMSLSTTKSDFRHTLQELADQAYFRRCLLVAAAHNMPVLSFPWTFSSVVSVASHDQADPMTYFYNPSPPAEFHARGVRVPVAWAGGKVVRSTGNSFAAPHIAGICALILSKHPWLTPFQLKTVLYLAADNTTQNGEPDVL